MKTSILAAAVAVLTLGLASTADARVDASSQPRAERAMSATSTGRTYSRHTVRHASKARYSTRMARSSGNGGGSSRSCLTSEARNLLGRIESQFGPVSVISTCRPGAVIATSGKPSKHRSGQAVDFEAGSRKQEIVQWLIANHHSGGTMTYRDMSHIHVDIGYHFVQLGANSGHRG